MTSEANPLDLLVAAAESARGSLYQLVLLVGPAGKGKTRLLRELQGREGWRTLNVSLALAARLLDLTVRQRSLQAADVLADIVREQSAGAEERRGPLLLDNLELLFEASLQLEPLNVLQRLSRNRVLIAAWPGEIANGFVTYAQPGHPEYRRYPLSDMVCVEL